MAPPAITFNTQQLQTLRVASGALNTGILARFQRVPGYDAAINPSAIVLDKSLKKIKAAQEAGDVETVEREIAFLPQRTADFNLAISRFIDRTPESELNSLYDSDIIATGLKRASRLFANSTPAFVTQESPSEHLNKLFIQTSLYVGLFKERHPGNSKIADFEGTLRLLPNLVDHATTDERVSAAKEIIAKLKQEILVADPRIEEDVELKVTLAERRREKSIQAQPWFGKLSDAQKATILVTELSFADRSDLFFSYHLLTIESYETPASGVLTLMRNPVVDMHIFSEAAEDGTISSYQHYRIDNMGGIEPTLGLDARKPDPDAFVLSPVQNANPDAWPRMNVLYKSSEGKPTGIGISVACKVRELDGRRELVLNVVSGRSGLDYTKFSGRTQMIQGALNKAIAYWKEQHPGLDVVEIQWWLSSGDRKMIAQLATAATEEEKELVTLQTAAVLGADSGQRFRDNPSIGVRFGVGNSSPGRILADLGFQKIRWSNPKAIENGIAPRAAADSPANVMFVAYPSTVPDYPEAPFKRGVEASSIGSKVLAAMNDPATGAKHYPFNEAVMETLRDAENGDVAKKIQGIPGVVKGYEILNQMRSDPNYRAAYEENLAVKTLDEMKNSANPSIRRLAEEGRILDIIRLRLLVKSLKTVGIETVRIENKLYTAEQWIAKFVIPAVFVDNTLVDATHSAYIHITSIARDIEYLRMASGIGADEDLSKVDKSRWILSPENYMKSLYLNSITVTGNGFSTDPDAKRALTLWDILHDIFASEAAQAYSGYDGKSYLAAIPESDWALVGAGAGYRDTVTRDYSPWSREAAFTPDVPPDPEPIIFPARPIAIDGETDLAKDKRIKQSRPDVLYGVPMSVEGAIREPWSPENSAEDTPINWTARGN